MSLFSLPNEGALRAAQVEQGSIAKKLQKIDLGPAIHDALPHLVKALRKPSPPRAY